MTKHLISLTHEPTRLTRWGQLVGILKSCKVDANWDEAVKDAQSPQCKFDIDWAKLKNKLKLNDYKESNCDKLMCPDGQYFTTEKAQALCIARLNKDLTYKSAYQTLVLSLFAFHGNRPQDWCDVRLHKDTRSIKNESYFAYEKRELHLFAGKTQKEGTERVVKVDTKVVLALKHYLKYCPVGYITPWMVPTQEDLELSANANGLRKCLQNALWGKKTPAEVKLAVPVAKLNLQDFRHLYETHIRYSPSKLTTQEIDTKMKEIGHSPSTALRIYAELYKKIYAQNNEPRCEQNSQAPSQSEAEEADESKEGGGARTACSEAEHGNQPSCDQAEGGDTDQEQVPATYQGGA
jgi:hypothetical protein